MDVPDNYAEERQTPLPDGLIYSVAKSLGGRPPQPVSASAKLLRVLDRLAQEPHVSIVSLKH